MHACSVSFNCSALLLQIAPAGRLGGGPLGIGVAIFRSLKRVVCCLSASCFCISFNCIICGGLNFWFRALIRSLKAFACNLSPWRFQFGRLQKTRCAPSRRLFCSLSKTHNMHACSGFLSCSPLSCKSLQLADWEVLLRALGWPFSGC